MMYIYTLPLGLQVHQPGKEKQKQITSKHVFNSGWSFGLDIEKSLSADV